MDSLKIPIDDYTTPCPATAGRHATIAEVSQLMADHGIRHVPIVDGDRPIGILSDRDVKMLTALPGGKDLLADQIMGNEIYMVTAGTMLETAVLEMSRRKIGSAMVTENGKLAGIFTSTDALNALVEILRGDV